MKTLVKLYNMTLPHAHVVYITLLFLAATSCNHTTFGTLTNTRRAQLTTDVNQQRARQGLAPLTLSEELSASADKYAHALAAAGNAPETSPPLERLISDGVFARFALSATVRAPSASEAYRQLFANPLHAGKLQHNGISHIGFGLAHKAGQAILVVDMARLVDKIDTDKVAADLLTQINANRKRISVAPLTLEPALTAAAKQLNLAFITSQTSQDVLIESVRNELSTKQMSLGKITIAFQTASVLSDFVLPERTSDPNARFAGIAVAQGNVKGQDAGVLMLALILATPPDGSGATGNIHKLPPPKAMPDGHRPSKKASLEEQAWLATLVGNHKKAAALFLKAHRKTKEPRFMYEAARAYARNDNTAAAIETMKRYAQLCEKKCTDAEQKTATEMIEKLKNGESIFATSKEAQYSVEAKRFFILGQKLFADGEWEGAIDAFGQAYAFAPQPDLIYNIGLAHLKAGDVGDALDFFQEYQRLVPEAQSTEQAQQLFAMGVELYNVGQYDAAAKRFAMAYSYLPLEEILYNLALCHQALGETKEALRIFQDLADKATDKKLKTEYKQHIEELQK